MSANKIILGIVGAAVAGVVIGLLVAPEDSKKTIKKLRKKTNSLAGDLIAALEKSKAKATDVVADLKKDGKSYADEATGKAEEYVDSARAQVGNL
ncbi:YtxH domain-containing protein [Dyadobacter sp. CY261]|uniref:YtxH domain-containing protein n=1 Tax=Dyadobacter sp. CY261 TaxID=2907203 RepID=UPI001F1C1444|nr:YtxH domain-containing protein [Dyadobacter sp. CY261]MCF0070394.1 YtxH domain-containing protein [Dyadobacter sp. CY261]